MTRLILALVAVFAAAPSLCETQTPKVAIIIDDLGYQWEAGMRAISLPGPISFAVLPHAPRASALAEAASNSGKEVLLHLPLQAMGARHSREPEHITVDMGRDELAHTFRRALEAVPQAVGVNNHQGSLLTRYAEHMEWLMQLIQEQPSLFFVDSYTTHHSIALDAAMKVGVPSARRDVFLDHERTPEQIRAQIEHLKDKARRDGEVVAIGHPYPETLAALEVAIPEMLAEGFELVPISRMVSLQESHNRPSNAGSPGLYRLDAKPATMTE